MSFPAPHPRRSFQVQILVPARSTPSYHSSPVRLQRDMLLMSGLGRLLAPERGFGGEHRGRRRTIPSRSLSFLMRCQWTVSGCMGLATGVKESRMWREAVSCSMFERESMGQRRCHGEPWFLYHKYKASTAPFICHDRLQSFITGPIEERCQWTHMYKLTFLQGCMWPA